MSNAPHIHTQTHTHTHIRSRESARTYIVAKILNLWMSEINAVFATKQTFTYTGTHSHALTSLLVHKQTNQISRAQFLFRYFILGSSMRNNYWQNEFRNTHTNTETKSTALNSSKSVEDPERNWSIEQNSRNFLTLFEIKSKTRTFFCCFGEDREGSFLSRTKE